MLWFSVQVAENTAAICSSFSDLNLNPLFMDLQVPLGESGTKLEFYYRERLHIYLRPDEEMQFETGDVNLAFPDSFSESEYFALAREQEVEVILIAEKTVKMAAIYNLMDTLREAGIMEIKFAVLDL